MRRLVLLTAFVCLTFLGSAREARLYPANNTAAASGIVRVNFEDYGLGKGAMSADLADGEHLSGECSTQDNATYGFGSIISQAGGAVATTTLSGTSMGGTQQGTASLFGDRGTMMQCEYVVNVLTSPGAGACKANKGAFYQLHF
jgi:hypothetical protein